MGFLPHSPKHEMNGRDINKTLFQSRSKKFTRFLKEVL